MERDPAVRKYLNQRPDPLMVLNAKVTASNSVATYVLFVMGV